MTNAVFDREWYLATYADVAAAGIDPLDHYLTSGRDEGRLPGPTWDDADDMAGSTLTAKRAPLHMVRADIEAEIPGHRSSTNGPRILVVGHAAGTELFGAERSLLELLDGFATIGHDVVVTVPTQVNEAYIDELRARCLTVHIVPVPPRRPNEPPNDELIDHWCHLIDRHSIQAVHVNTIVPREPVLAARARGIAGVVHAHEVPLGDAAMCAAMDASPEEIIANVTAEATYVIGNSGFTAIIFDLPGRTAVVPNIVDLNEFPVADRPTDVPTVTLIGYPTVRKGVRDFARLAAMLRGRVNARFVIVGPTAPAIDCLAEVDLPDNLTLVGYTQTSSEAIAQADIVVNLSRCREAFARTVLEGMAAGLPIVAYNRGAIPLLVDHRRTGLLVPFDDAEALAAAVERLCLDPELRRRMGAAGREIAATRYTAANLVHALRSAYTAILPSKDVSSQRQNDVVVAGFSRQNRSEFREPFFAGYRSRWSYVTGVAFVDAKTLVSNSELGHRLHTISFDTRRRRARIIAETVTRDESGEVTTDLIQSDGRGRVLTANGWKSSASLYRHNGKRARWRASIHFTDPEPGFCHAARFVPGHDDLFAACTITGTPGVRFISGSDGALRFQVTFDGRAPKDVAFRGSDRMAAALHRTLIETSPIEEHGASIALVAVDLQNGGHEILDEHELPNATLDALCFHNDRLYATNSGADTIMVFDARNDQLHRLPDMEGFAFPHQVAVSPDGEWLAVACFGDSTVVLRPLTE